jgi:hypothetical protein
MITSGTIKNASVHKSAGMSIAHPRLFADNTRIRD